MVGAAHTGGNQGISFSTIISHAEFYSSILNICAALIVNYLEFDNKLDT